MPRRESARNTATPAASDSATERRRRIAVAPAHREAEPRAERRDPAPAAPTAARALELRKAGVERPGGRSSAASRRSLVESSDSCTSSTRSFSARVRRQAARGFRPHRGDPSATRAGNRCPAAPRARCPIPRTAAGASRPRRARSTSCAASSSPECSAPSASKRRSSMRPLIARTRAGGTARAASPAAPSPRACARSLRGGQRQRALPSRSRTRAAPGTRAAASAAATAGRRGGERRREAHESAEAADREPGGQRDREQHRRERNQACRQASRRPCRRESRARAARRGPRRRRAAQQAASQSRATRGIRRDAGDREPRQPARREPALADVDDDRRRGECRDPGCAAHSCRRRCRCPCVRMSTPRNWPMSSAPTTEPIRYPIRVLRPSSSKSRDFPVGDEPILSAGARRSRAAGKPPRSCSARCRRRGARWSGSAQTTIAP